MDLSAPKLYIPMLNGLILGEALSVHDGVRCFPAIRHSNQEKYIVKVITVPASQVQLDAMMLTGAFPNREAALEYYMDVSRDILRETDILRQLSQQEGFIPYLDAQIIPSDDFTGYEVYLLGKFRRSLERIFVSETLTHKDILHMALDLCASLSACRREGYLYVDLKPENIFYSEEQGYRIGDVGFAALASLAYSSLPEKYRSRYTAPELLDEMAVLNETADVYALGLVLYQTYNGGKLPEIVDRQTLPAPLYADYEFTDIILKACNPDAAKRWKDPAELAQAIIGYIQRNSVKDTPIIPAITEQIPEGSPDVEEFLPEADAEVLQQEMDALDDIDELDDWNRETANDGDSSEELPVSEDITQILAQADELIAHELPDPAVAPEPIDVPMPEPIALEDETEEEPICESIEQPDEILPEEEPEEVPAAEPELISEEIQSNKQDTVKLPPVPRPKRHFPWRAVAISLVIIALLSAGIGAYYYYDNFYLQRIDDLILEQNNDMLSVKVITSVDNTLLTVVCFDSYGNTMRKSVTAGVAIFTGLDPQTHYSVRLEISGFHRLVGDVSDSFTTDAQTQISNLMAGIGNEDGSVLIRFDANETRTVNWIISYSAPGTEEKQVPFQGNVVQISDLQIGLEYTFVLSREDGQKLAGQTQVQYTAGKILVAENLSITACGNGRLTAQWENSSDIQNTLWVVRCYNNSGYDQTITTEEQTATFTGMEHAVVCTVEVTLQGMPRSISTTIEANPITVEQFHFTNTTEGTLQVTWDCSGVASNGWILTYIVDNAPQQDLTLTENTANLLLIPGGTYTITVTAIDASRQFGGSCSYNCPKADPFQGWGVTKDDLQTALCIRPESDTWTAGEVPPSQYTTIYAAGQAIGLVIQCDAEPEMAEETVRICFVFHDANGKLLYVAEIEVLWNSLWVNNGCALDLPWLPEDPGEYKVCVFFDDREITELAFSVSETE